MMRIAAILTAVFVPMLFEAARSARNERALRARGAVEPAGDVYRVMRIAYPACFLGMAAEGLLRGGAPGSWTAAGSGVYLAGKTLKYWAIASLGARWTFRVLVLPMEPRIRSGPYRWLRHPNYLGVAGELAGVALAAPAPISGAAAVAGFGVLMLSRIRVEDRALDACER